MTPDFGPDAFLQQATQFRLGALLTESPHPRTLNLSEVARRDAADGLALLFDVDRDVVDTYDRWSRSSEPHALCDLVVHALRRGGRLFFTGCGATGRLSIQLTSIWRQFWQERRRLGQAEPPPEAWEHRAFSVMAGGDYALIKSVEGFEDFAPFGRRQLADLGVAAGDVVFAITEGGETSFVIGTAWQGVEAGAHVVFVYNNPDDVLRAHVARSREVLDDPRIRKVNLTTGPMAITGSTRMQATSIQLIVLLTVLEMALRTVLADAGAAAEPGAIHDASEVPAAVREGLGVLHARLTADTFRQALGVLVTTEEQVYRRGGRMSYFADSLAVDVLTDTTERSPTFCTPSFRKWDDRQAAESWAFLFTPAPTTDAAWTRLLARPPQTIEWSEDDLSRLLDPAAAARQAEIVREIGLRELLRFRIGQDGLEDRPPRPGDGAVAVLGPRDAPLIDPGGFFAVQLRRWLAAGASAGVLVVAQEPSAGPLEAAARRVSDRVSLATVAVPPTPLVTNAFTRLGVKLALNALSTCTMVRLGRVLGNRMIWVVPSNLKLIDRATRYIRDLAGVSYEQACRTLFEVMAHVEPRRRLGQAYPAPVGVAVMQLRHGLSLEEAERKLLDDLS